MRLLIILLVLVGLSFVALTIYTLTRDDEPSAQASASNGCFSPPPLKDGEIDEDKVENWCTDRPEALSRASRSMADKLKLTDTPVTVHVAFDGRLSAPAAAGKKPQDEGRVAVFRWKSGAPMRIYNRYHDHDQTVCVCSPGTVLQSSQLARCDAKWVVKLRQPDGRLICREHDDEAGVIVGRDGGDVFLNALDGTATVDQP